MEQQDLATRLLTFSKSSLQMHERIIIASKHEKQIRPKKAILCGSLLKVFNKGTVHESWRIPVSNLKTLSGQMIQIKGKNKLTRIILLIKPS